jgi:hypothetical protein
MQTDCSRGITALCMYVFVCVCVCVRERERERESFYMEACFQNLKALLQILPW